MLAPDRQDLWRLTPALCLSVSLGPKIPHLQHKAPEGTSQVRSRRSSPQRRASVWSPITLTLRLLCTQEHLRMGQAIAPLLDEGVLLFGSGLSYHSMRGFSRDGARSHASAASKARSYSAP